MASGVIIAGGRSTRFGDEDKVIADLAGTPMIRRVADRIGPIIDELVVNCRRDQVDPVREALTGYDHEVRFAVDSEPDRGPMSGIRTGLREAQAEYAFVVACDMPFVDPEFASYLLDRSAGYDAAVPRLSDGWFQTTQAVYRREPMATACDEALERGARKVIDPLSHLEYAVVDETEVREHAGLETFENVNTREELEAAVDRIE